MFVMTSKPKEPGTRAKQQMQMASKQVNPVSLTLFFVLLAAGILMAALMELAGVQGWIAGASFGAFVLAALYVLFAIKIANQWEKAVVLRYGRFTGLRGPGLFWIIPVVDGVAAWIDHRVMVTPFMAEKTLTRDTVPVDVDAVLFWVVWDAEKPPWRWRTIGPPSRGPPRPRCATSLAR